MDSYSNISNPGPKGQQSGQINFQRWSIKGHPGTEIDVVDNIEYQRKFDGQIVRVSPKQKRKYGK